MKAVANNPDHKSIEQVHKGVVTKRDDKLHPKYAAPLGTKKVHGWCPSRVRA